MAIKKIAILPPLAFARFGSHPKPVDSYTLEPPKADDNPLGYRRIVPEPTFQVSENGEITGKETPKTIIFKEGDRVRPVAPFFELWGELDDGSFVHLDQNMLEKAKLVWCVEVKNRKVFRRTN